MEDVDPNARKINANKRKSQGQQTSYRWGADHPGSVGIPGLREGPWGCPGLPRTCGILLRSAPHTPDAPIHRKGGKASGTNQKV